MPLEFLETRPPLPPLDLIGRVVQPFAPENGPQEQVAFDTAPQAQLRGLERALGIVDREFADFDRMLDFGCGPGRYARQLEALSRTTEIHGADIDQHAIAWLRENVPYGQFEQIPHEPPTVYPDGHFDLVVNHSVFTHLPEELQNAWMVELQRITKPGGVLLLTLHSTTQWNAAARDIEGGGDDVEAMRRQLEGDGILFVADDHFVGSTHPDFYHTTFHAPWYVFERWTAWFDIAAYVPLGSDSQDLVVLRRRDAGADGQTPIGHGRGASEAPEAVLPGTATRSKLLSELEGVLVEGPPRTVLGRLKRRVLHHDLARQARINELLLRLLQEQPQQQPNLLAEGSARETQMLRVGLYELGRRLSIVADELRDEVAAVEKHRDRP